MLGHVDKQDEMIKINISTKPKMGFYELNIMFEDESRVRFIARAISLTAKSKRTENALRGLKAYR
ncbi:hypothetical protein [Fictibacillus sp. WQ 8-8]|uniref:DUF4931 family protein n=1 Tax=Fictibacillus sp. WQ 8-8 TaxID=2938788 RepID=UPI0035C6ACD9